MRADLALYRLEAPHTGGPVSVPAEVYGERSPETIWPPPSGTMAPQCWPDPAGPAWPWLAVDLARDPDRQEETVISIDDLMELSEERMTRDLARGDPPVVRCIGCGCHDLAACVDEETGEPCHWLALSIVLGAGVCSACPDELKRWHGGDREPRAAP